jgi:hypothetical protein
MTLAPVGSAGITSWAADLAPARQLAEIVAGTDFVPAALRNNPDACCACIMYGLSIGIDPMVALQSIHVVDGRPQPSAELARALILAAGHSITIHTATDELCKVSGLRRGAPESERLYREWTIADARKAGLLNRPNWQRYPRAMLLARATGDLGRILFPDAMKGLGHISEDEPEELDSWAAQTIPEETPAPKRAVRRRPRAIAGQPVQTVPLPEVVPDGQPEPGHPPWSGTLDPWADAPAASAPPAQPHVPQDAPQDAPAPHSTPEGQPAESQIGDGLRRSLWAALSRLGIDSEDRAQRLALWSALLGRRLGTSKELTRADGLLLVRRMNDLETGAVDWTYDIGADAVTLHRIESEPPR